MMRNYLNSAFGSIFLLKQICLGSIIGIYLDGWLLSLQRVDHSRNNFIDFFLFTSSSPQQEPVFTPKLCFSRIPWFFQRVIPLDNRDAYLLLFSNISVHKFALCVLMAYLADGKVLYNPEAFQQIKEIHYPGGFSFSDRNEQKLSNFSFYNNVQYIQCPISHWPLIYRSCQMN